MQYLQWVKQHPKASTFGFVFGMLLSFVVFYVADISVNSKDMLQSLIQAEATLLGLFGIIASYLLVSFDTRFDRLEQQRFDCEIANKPQIAESYRNRITLLEKNRKEAIEILMFTGILFVLSLLLSIIALGSVDTNFTLSIVYSYFGLGFFFNGIFSLFLMFYTMSRYSLFLGYKSNRSISDG